MDNFGLTQNTIDIIKNYFKSIPEIEKVKIYGSRALGTYRKGSDIDLALFGNINSNLVTKISYEIDELPTPYMFDITDYSTIGNEKLRAHIDEFGKIFYESEK